MNRKGIGIIAGTAGVAMAALIAMGAAIMAFSQVDGEGSGSMDGTGIERGLARSAIPPIDRQAPARTETATFALG